MSLWLPCLRALMRFCYAVLLVYLLLVCVAFKIRAFLSAEEILGLPRKTFFETSLNLTCEESSTEFWGDEAKVKELETCIQLIGTAHKWQFTNEAVFQFMAFGLSYFTGRPIIMLDRRYIGSSGMRARCSASGPFDVLPRVSRVAFEMISTRRAHGFTALCV